MSPFLRKGGHKKRRHSLPWINDSCKHLMAHRDQLLKKSLKSGLTTDRQNFTCMRNKVIQTLRMAKANFFMTAIENAKGNSKLLWENINKLLGLQKQNYNKGLDLKFSGKMVSEPTTLTTKLNEYFLNSILEISQHFLNSNATQFMSNSYNAVAPVTTGSAVASPLQLAAVEHASGSPVGVVSVAPVPAAGLSPLPADLICVIKEISTFEALNIISLLKSSKTRDDFGLDSSFLKLHKTSLAQPITHLRTTFFCALCGVTCAEMSQQQSTNGKFVG